MGGMVTCESQSGCRGDRRRDDRAVRGEAGGQSVQTLEPHELRQLLSTAGEGCAIPKKSGGVRILGIPTVADRVAQTAVKMWLEPRLDPIFCGGSYGYRPGK